MNNQYILFDLDGTLTDSKLGITKCVQYALQSFGIYEENLDNLEGYIGPSLDESFEKFHGLVGEDNKKAIEKYRERFKDIGIFENEVIDGIIPCLDKLKENGKVLALATCKPEVFAVRILEHFGLKEYFTVAVGSELDGRRKHKKDVIDEVFRRLNSELFDGAVEDEEYYNMKAESVMVGDRNQDVNGAHDAGIKCVGVRFGYANENELEDAGADIIVDTVEEMEKVLLSDEVDEVWL